MGLYWEVYFRKTKGIIKILVKKKKKKKEKYWTQRIEKDWLKSRKRRYAGISIGHFLQAKNKALTFYSNQALDFQYQKENDQECTALKSLGRWNEEGIGGS